eukprot:TRINITY_DN3604_c0_g1_i1.p1 TRINITY_DN3604_c0_g1~~TRINITY_DN3604_c0_g1_i1.p1  ORF type:complete len:670 (+),score=77.89 TRINITY_DN3604_c0_g1_i1:86-2095(+)
MHSYRYTPGVAPHRTTGIATEPIVVRRTSLGGVSSSTEGRKSPPVSKWGHESIRKDTSDKFASEGLKADNESEGTDNSESHQFADDLDKRRTLSRKLAPPIGSKMGEPTVSTRRVPIPLWRQESTTTYRPGSKAMRPETDMSFERAPAKLRSRSADANGHGPAVASAYGTSKRGPSPGKLRRRTSLTPRPDCETPSVPPSDSETTNPLAALTKSLNGPIDADLHFPSRTRKVPPAKPVTAVPATPGNTRRSSSKLPRTPPTTVRTVETTRRLSRGNVTVRSRAGIDDRDGEREASRPSTPRSPSVTKQPIQEQDLQSAGNNVPEANVIWERVLAQRESTISDLQRKLEASERRAVAVVDLETKLRSREAKIQQLELEQQQQIAKWRTEMLSKDYEMILKAERRRAEMGDAMARIQRELDDTKQRLHESETLSMMADRSPSEKLQARVTDLEEILEHRANEIATLKAALTEKSAEITAHEDTARALSQRITSLEVDIKQKDTVIAALKQVIESREIHDKDANAKTSKELQELRASSQRYETALLAQTDKNRQLLTRIEELKAAAAEAVAEAAASAAAERTPEVDPVMHSRLVRSVYSLYHPIWGCEKTLESATQGENKGCVSFKQISATVLDSLVDVRESLRWILRTLLTPEEKAELGIADTEPHFSHGE